MPKGFGYGGESANQERSNLLKDNPVAREYDETFSIINVAIKRRT